MLFCAGVEFSFEQLEYTIRENGVSQTVCVLLVTGSIQAPVQISVTAARGTATGKETHEQYIVMNSIIVPILFFFFTI